ncbi:internalin [Listeria ivanovii]|uniref:GW domain-containing glycosaminoglycan-binding protein n=1 Tax=Listeria ivanovii TaxID=1638 RepID=UPI000DA827DB|nr:GW domain-containing glycosaminoglycan-binding protein [Listeria ivanovii]PZH10986.1 internalin [Listeria ivanovii]
MKGRHHLWLINVLKIILVIIVGIWINTYNETKVEAKRLAKPTPINQIFPDPALAEVIKENLGKKKVSDLVSQNDLNGLLWIQGEGKGIQSIKGLEYLTKLINLFLTDNQIADLSPISELTTLNWITLERNRVHDLTALTKLTNLECLTINNNRITDVKPLANLTKLEILDMDNNQVSDISGLANLGQLETLRLERNRVSDISALTNLINLVTLNLFQNQVSDITPLAGLKKLKRLEINNQVCTSKPVNFQSNFVVPNIVKSVDGTLVKPDYISHNGKYTNPNVIWQLPGFVREVQYTFYQKIKYGNTKAVFSGEVKQPLIAEFNFTYDVDGKQNTVRAKAGTSLSQPISPTKPKYLFNGWFTAKNGGKKWDFKVDKMPTTNLTLFAQFTAKEYVPGMEKVVNLSRYVNVSKEKAFIYSIPVEKEANKKGTLANHKFKALAIDRQVIINGKTWDRIKNIGWTNAVNLSADRYDKELYNKAITAYARVKKAPGNDVWTKPYNTAGAKKVKPLSAYVGKNLRIVREAKTPITTWYQFSVNGKVVGWVDMRALTNFYLPSMEKGANLVRYVNLSKANSGVYALPVEDAPIKKGTLLNHKFKALAIDRQVKLNNQLWYRIKNIGWTNAANLSLNRYDKILHNKAITAYARVKKKPGNIVWTKPYNTAGAKKVKPLSAYVGKNLRIVREAKPPITTWYQFSVNGKVVGWVDIRALNVFYKPNMEKGAKLTRYVKAGKVSEGCFSLPVADAPIKKGKLKSYKGKALRIDRQVTISGQLWYRIKNGSRLLGWTKATNLSARK